MQDNQAASVVANDIEDRRVLVGAAFAVILIGVAIAFEAATSSHWWLRSDGWHGSRGSDSPLVLNLLSGGGFLFLLAAAVVSLLVIPANRFRAPLIMSELMLIAAALPFLSTLWLWVFPPSSPNGPVLETGWAPPTLLAALALVTAASGYMVKIALQQRRASASMLAEVEDRAVQQSLADLPGEGQGEQ